MPNPSLALFDLIQSHRITQVIYVAAKLGIAEALRNGPRSSDELAAATGTHPDALRRLMRALASIGICAHEPDGRYVITATGSALDRQSEQSFGAWAIFEVEVLTPRWNELLETVRAGKTFAERAGEKNSFDFMARAPGEIQTFNAAMADLTRFVTPDVLSAFDFGRVPHLLDVGGGTGEFVAAATIRHRHLRATIFDLPRCENGATNRLRQAGVSDRATFVAGDFFKAIPAIAGTILLKSVIHDWDDERSNLILKNCRAALPDDGTLLLVERILPDTPTCEDGDRAHVMSDLNMMCGPGGRERSRDDYDRLLRGSGFCLDAIRPAGRFNVIEARTPNARKSPAS